MKKRRQRVKGRTDSLIETHLKKRESNSKKDVCDVRGNVRSRAALKERKKRSQIIVVVASKHRACCALIKYLYLSDRSRLIHVFLSFVLGHFLPPINAGLILDRFKIHRFYEVGVDPLQKCISQYCCIQSILYASNNNKKYPTTNLRLCNTVQERSH